MTWRAAVYLPVMMNWTKGQDTEKGEQMNDEERIEELLRREEIPLMADSGFDAAVT